MENTVNASESKPVSKSSFGATDVLAFAFIIAGAYVVMRWAGEA